MDNASAQGAADAELRALEARIDELIRACTSLKEEHRLLRAHRDSIQAERARLLERNEAAKARVESIIGRLKSLEASQ